MPSGISTCCGWSRTTPPRSDSGAMSSCSSRWPNAKIHATESSRRGKNLRSPSSRVLIWWRQFIAERFSSVRGPIRIHKHLAREQYHVRLTVAHNVVRLFRFGYKTNGGGRDACAVADFFGERHLVARRNGDLRVHHHPAGTAIHQVHAFSLEQLCQNDALFDVPATFLPVSCRNAHCQR